MNDDEDWLAALAGHERTGSDAMTRREAAWLRAAQRRWVAQPQLLAEPAGAQDRLLQRARAEGLLRRRWCAGCADRWQRWLGTPWRMGAAGLVLASVLVAFVALPLLQPAPEDSVLRAGVDGVVLLQDAAPAARRDRLAAALAAAGATVRPYQRLGRYGIDAELPATASPALSALLKAEHLAWPTGGVLRIEVESPAR